MQDSPRIIPKLAFSVLNDFEYSFKQSPKLTNEWLIKLHSLFGPILASATELLDTCKIIRYETEDGCRRVYKIGANVEWHTIYENINFCLCQLFRCQVLEKGANLTCKHVLGVRLNSILGRINVKIEKVSDSQFVEFLNEQLNYLND